MKVLVNMDIALYPNNIINHKFIRFPEVLDVYMNLKMLRIQAKRNGEKIKDVFYKLILNSTSGLLDNEHSWLYYNEGAVGLRLTGQLQMLKSIEKLTQLGFQVISTNTDGIETLVPIDKEQLFYDTMTDLQTSFNLEWEHEEYIQLNYININSYYAITSNGKAKRKGDFKLDFNEKNQREIMLGDSCNFLIIPKVIDKHFKTNIPVDELLHNWKDHGYTIYDFCASAKVDRSYTVYHNNQIQQRLNRYYASTNGAYLFKKQKEKKNGGRSNLEHMLSKSGVTILNKYVELDPQDYKINYKYYKSEINNLLNNITNKLTLF